MKHTSTPEAANVRSRHSPPVIGLATRPLRRAVRLTALPHRSGWLRARCANVRQAIGKVTLPFRYTAHLGYFPCSPGGAATTRFAAAPAPSLRTFDACRALGAADVRQEKGRSGLPFRRAAHLPFVHASPSGAATTRFATAPAPSLRTFDGCPASHSEWAGRWVRRTQGRQAEDLDPSSAARRICHSSTPRGRCLGRDFGRRPGGAGCCPSRARGEGTHPATASPFLLPGPRRRVSFRGTPSYTSARRRRHNGLRRRLRGWACC